MDETSCGTDIVERGGETHLQTLRAVIDRIIPPDDFPGAWSAGAGDYILRQLGGDLRHLSASINQGLTMLDAEAIRRFELRFTALEPYQQDAVLERVAAGDVLMHWPIAPPEFFATLVTLTNEGYYGDPGNGGNRGQVAWQMIGYETRLRGEEHA